VWLVSGFGEPVWLESGRTELDTDVLSELLAEFDRHDWATPLVRNGSAARAASLAAPWIRRLMVMPLRAAGRTSGWLVATGAPTERAFTEVDSRLFETVAALLALHVRNLTLDRQNDELKLSFVRSMVTAIDAKDPYTRGHSDRVAVVAQALAAKLGLDAAQQSSIRLAGLLHDLGKVGVDDAILRKPGRLTPQEFAQIRRHPEIGRRILADLNGFEHVLPGVLHHHEAFDGSGYPHGLAAERIPRMARILAVADAFDAMGTDRPYRPGLTPHEVASILEAGAGRQWDPVVVRALMADRRRIEQLWMQSDSHGPASRPQSDWRR
jgi:HD-GYP domain-containing protein (c-di-GMP phosphodiesterase class II)